jgi:MinD-like ATPase involved in chromosome partitioning or flagellar assembly
MPMSKCISIHSSRGGTGKTVLATNIAVLLAKKGSNVALLDLDFRSPSLTGVFSKLINPQLDVYLNSYLDGRCPIESATIDLTERLNLKGKLLVGFANPDIAAIRNIAEKSRSWEVSALKRLFALRSQLFKEMNIQYCFYDTTPGVQYTSLNAVVSSDLSVIISTLDSLDLSGTERLLAELYNPFEKKAVILLNKVFPENQPYSNKEKLATLEQLSKTFKSPIIGTIPCYCKVLQADRSTILSIEDPEDPFVKNLEEVTQQIVAAI